MNKWKVWDIPCNYSIACYGRIITGSVATNSTSDVDFYVNYTHVSTQNFESFIMLTLCCNFFHLFKKCQSLSPNRNPKWRKTSKRINCYIKLNKFLTLKNNFQPSSFHVKQIVVIFDGIVVERRNCSFFSFLSFFVIMCIRHDREPTNTKNTSDLMECNHDCNEMATTDEKRRGEWM